MCRDDSKDLEWGRSVNEGPVVVQRRSRVVECGTPIPRSASHLRSLPEY
jgi:hypothetical protein